MMNIKRMKGNKKTMADDIFNTPEENTTPNETQTETTATDEIPTVEAEHLNTEKTTAEAPNINNTSETVPPQQQPVYYSPYIYQAQPQQQNANIPPQQPTYYSTNYNSANGYVPPVQQASGTTQTFDVNKTNKRSKRGLIIFLAILLSVTVLAGGIFVGYTIKGNVGSLIDNDDENDISLGGTVEIQQGTVPEKDGIEADENGVYSADEVSQLVSPSVVNIMVYNDTYQNSALASGVVLDKTGYILSNDHIYSEIPSAKFVITMSDGESYDAIYIAGDSRSDLCVLKMTELPEDELTPAVFADSSKVTVGEEVIAIGNPYGLSGTVTKGIISAATRRISFTSTDSTGASVRHSMRVIQTDTALNSGNSGGALVNMYGQVVGISSSKIVLEGYEGLCFAIPSSDAIKYAKSLIENNRVTNRGKLGISYYEITGAVAKASGTPYGLQIQEISINSGLYGKGLSDGDIIVEIDDKPIVTEDVALDVIDDKYAGDAVKLKVYIASNGSYKTITAELIEDTSASSYSTQQQQQQTTTYSFFEYQP